MTRKKQTFPAYDVNVPGLSPHPMLHIPRGTASFDGAWRKLVYALKRLHTEPTPNPNDEALIDECANRLIDAYVTPERKGMPEEHYLRRQQRLDWYLTHLSAPSNPAYRYLTSRTKNRLLIDLTMHSDHLDEDEQDGFESDEDSVDDEFDIGWFKRNF